MRIPIVCGALGQLFAVTMNVATYIVIKSLQVKTWSGHLEIAPTMWKFSMDSATTTTVAVVFSHDRLESNGGFLPPSFSYCSLH